MQNKNEIDLAKIKRTDTFSRLKFFSCSCKESVFSSIPTQGTWPTNWAKEVSMRAVYSLVF